MVRTLMDGDTQAAPIGTPWYVSAFMKVGFPAAIAVWLIYNQSTNIHAEHVEIKTIVTQQTESQATYFAQMVYLNTLQCRQAMKTEEQKQQCTNVAYIKGVK